MDVRALARVAPRDLENNGWSLRDLCGTLEAPCANRLRDAYAPLDTAVRAG